MLYSVRPTAGTSKPAPSSFFTNYSYRKKTLITMKNIVILGGSFAGVSTAHRIFKQATNSTPFKITLVSPNTDFYWNIASPRGIIPGQIEDDKLFQPISAGFDQYPAGKFEFVLGYAESLDIDAKKVRVSNNITLDYDFLVLGTGSNAKEGMPFKGVGSTEATKHALHDFQSKVAKAKTIVICGAGVTGVEVAGELGFEYGQTKKIILVRAQRLKALSRPTDPANTRSSEGDQQFSKAVQQLYRR